MVGSMVKSARKAFFAIVIAVLASVMGVACPTLSLAQPVVGTESKYSAIVIDANSGEVLYAKRADSPRYPASITKVMTLYLAFEAMAAGRLSAGEMIEVSKHAASMQPTKLGLRAGATISVDDAIRAIAVQSANDMAVAMAERIGGTESRFAALMTLRAQELGMENSRFVNASGLPDSRQVSTSRDIAILSRAIMRDFPQYYAYFSQRQFTYAGQTMNNHNRLLSQVAGVDGLKTGYTNSSGYNLAASAVRDGRRLIAVTLGGNSNATRDAHVSELLETGFDVIRRRDRGEIIAIAQNLFEPEPVGPMAPATAQGDAPEGRTMVADRSYDVPLRGPQVPEGITYARYVDPNAPVQAASVQVASATTTSAPSRPAAAPARQPAGRYVVQVGSFKTRADARDQLASVTRRFSQHFSSAEGVVGSAVGGFFRARYTGFTAEGARAACAALKARRMSCLVVSPG